MRSALSTQEASELLAAAESEIRALGVARLALLGSVLHGNARPDSDVDLLVQFFRSRISWRMRRSAAPSSGVWRLSETPQRGFPRSFVRSIRRSSGAPWPARDRLIHDYFGVDYEIVWDVLQNRILPLRAQIASIVDGS